MHQTSLGCANGLLDDPENDLAVHDFGSGGRSISASRVKLLFARPHGVIHSDV